MRYRNVIKLLLIILIGLILRYVFIPFGALTFSYDQGRDAFIVREILAGDFKIQGPPSSTPGLYHGVFYYYLLAPFYFLGLGNPIYPVFGLAVLNCLGILLMYYFARELNFSRPISLTLALFYAFSFEQSQYAVWLSNPSYAALTVPLYYYFLFKSRGQNRWSPLLAGLFLGLSIQADIFLAYHIFPLLILFIIRTIPFTKQLLAKFITGLLIGILPLVIAQFKFGFTGFVAVRNLLLPSGINQTKALFTDTALIYLNQLTRTFALNLFPIQIFLGGLAGICLVFWFIRHVIDTPQKNILLAYLFSSLIAFPYGGVATPFVHVGIGFVIYLILGYFLSAILKRRFLFLIVITLITVGNLLAIFKNNPSGQTIFALQPDLTIKNETAAIDFIYRSENGTRFSLNSITSPLHINTSWSYLFNWYGESKYGYLPYWHGHDQIGLLGNNLQKTPADVTDYYLIIDPPEPNFVRFIQPGIEEENGFSKLEAEYNFGKIRVQKRVRI